MITAEHRLVMTLPVATRRTAAGSDAILAIIVGAH